MVEYQSFRMALKLLKFLVALALLPLVAAEVWTLIDLARVSIPAGQWRESWFVSFGAGFIAWLVIFIALPRTLWLYVLGHEFTHALAVMMAGGKITAFKVTSAGGHVMTDRVNWWIGLAPYFVPIYALVWMALWLTIDFYHPLTAWLSVFYFGIGFFWAFHVTFTVSMLHPRQTDLSREGYLFSGVIITLFNLITVLLLLALLGHDLPRATRTFWQRMETSYTTTGREIAAGWRFGCEEWSRTVTRSGVSR
jgi:hypothetical protein